MSSNNNNSSNDSGQRRRSSFTSQTLTSIFGRSNSSTGTPAFPGPASTAAAQDQRRRMSINGVGLSATSPTQGPFGFNRRGSVSTAGSESIDESAIEEDDGPGRSSNPTTPFTRRISFGAQALRSVRTAGSPGTNGEGGGFNWSEQLRSRAESSVSQSQRPLFSTSPPNKPAQADERTKSVSELQSPPAAIPPPVAPARPARQKPDAFGERILKGDFYMD